MNQAFTRGMREGWGMGEALARDLNERNDLAFPELSLLLQSFRLGIPYTLRPALGAARTPTLVLGSWASYAPYGVTKASTQASFEQQYAKHPSAIIKLSDTGYHFLMWDDPKWLQQEVREFLAH